MKTMIRCFLVISLVLSLSFVAFASVGQMGGKHIYLSIDTATFRGDSTTAFLEIYYSFGVGQLRLLPVDEGFALKARLDLTILSASNDSLVLYRAWEVPHIIRDSSELVSNRGLVGVLSFWLAASEYKVMIVATDANDEGNRDSLGFPINLRVLPSDILSLSDIELCSSIKQIPPDTANIFYKNTLEVIPNPSVIFGLGLPILYYYVEVYNLLRKAMGGEYAYSASVHDASGNEVIQQRRTKRRVHDSSVEVGTLNISKLKSGTYTFRFFLSDSMTQENVAREKKFFVYNPALDVPLGQADLREGGDYLASEYSLMSDEDISKQFEYARYIARDEEISGFDRLTDLEGKRRFIYQFWRRRDTDPTTDVNEVKQEYLQRVQHANANFRAPGKEGWRSDRGRVFILYGPPDELERHPNEIGSKPYEIWYYHGLQGGIEFVFIDRSTFSDYILVHSTHRNELRDDNWRQKLTK